MVEKTHLRYTVKLLGDKQVTLLGIGHGRTARDELHPRTARLIRKFHKTIPEAAIYAEHVGKAFLPRELIEKAQPLETKESSIDASLIIINLNRNPKPSGNPGSLAYRRQVREITEDFTRDVSESGKRRFRRELSYLVVFRSLEMADQLLRSRNKNNLAIMGAAHAPLVRKFLENPKLRERYRRLWEKK